MTAALLSLQVRDVVTWNDCQFTGVMCQKFIIAISVLLNEFESISWCKQLVNYCRNPYYDKNVSTKLKFFWSASLQAVSKLLFLSGGARMDLGGAKPGSQGFYTLLT